MLDKKAVINTVERYSDLVVKELSPAAVVLYGSYAKGNAHENSDIDVAVIFNGFKGDWPETSSLLYTCCRDAQCALLHADSFVQPHPCFLQHIIKVPLLHANILYSAPEA